MANQINQILAIEPKERLAFVGPFTKASSAVMTLRNPSDRKVCFKIRTTALKRYSMKPNSGIIDSLKTVQVIVTLQPGNYSPEIMNTDGFEISTVFVMNGETNQESVWKNANKDQVKQCILRCIFFAVPENNVSEKTRIEKFHSFDENDSEDINGNNKRKRESDENRPSKRLRRESPHDEEKLKKEGFKLDEDGYVIVHTDGSSLPHNESRDDVGASNGCGIWFGDGHPDNLLAPSGRNTHNPNSAEIEACTKAVKIASQKGIMKLLIKTDSRFTINSIESKVHKWRINGWKSSFDGSLVKCRREFQDFLEAAEKNPEFRYKFTWVPSHSNIHGNEAADRLARQGALQSGQMRFNYQYRPPHLEHRRFVTARRRLPQSRNPRTNSYDRR